MFKPDYSLPKDPQLVRDVMNRFPFVTLISHDENKKLSISHIPVVSQFENGQLKSIQGHFSRRNPQVEHLRKNNQVTLIFHGAHTYITPKWYRSGRDVPTWNYCVVHVHGKLSLKDSFEDIVENLKDLTSAFEKGDGAWQFELPSDLVEPKHLTGAIVAFEILPEQIESKFKLSQNRSLEDRQGVVDGLSTRSDDMSKEIYDLMKLSL